MIKPGGGHQHGTTHKENYEYTMNRLKHIAEQGYKVQYIWITNFKRYTLDLEESEKNGTPKPNLFDHMNVNKHYILGKQDTHLYYGCP